jgi:hypothetical protein
MYTVTVKKNFLIKNCILFLFGRVS